MSKDFKIIRNPCPHVCINILRTLFPDEISRVIRNSCIITVCAQFVCRIRRVSRRPRKRGRDRERERAACRADLILIRDRIVERIIAGLYISRCATQISRRRNHFTASR